MHGAEIPKIKDKLVASRAALLAEVEDLDAGDWEWRPSQEYWSVRQTLAHVGSAEQSHLSVAQALVSRRAIGIPGFDLDAWNAAQVAEREDWSPAEVLADLHADHEETMAFLDSLDPAMLTVTGTHPALGEVSVAQVLRIIALHDGMHRRDLARLRSQMRQATAPIEQEGES